MLIGAVFGAVFVFVNASSPLNTVLATVLQVAASVALAFIVFMWFTAGKRLRTGAAAPPESPEEASTAAATC
ncbi:hypothetical protein [Nonomuraea recticatena]|uniref:hypothetical protein n=1 Tax=Nonomuraea recticatena TaxID=46178 RepID=UPI0036184DF0